MEELKGSEISWRTPLPESGFSSSSSLESLECLMESHRGSDCGFGQTERHLKGRTVFPLKASWCTGVEIACTRLLLSTSEGCSPDVLECGTEGVWKTREAPGYARRSAHTAEKYCGI